MSVFLLVANASDFFMFLKNAFLFFSILDSRSEQILSPLPQKQQQSISSYTSPSASHTARETCSFPIQSDPTPINPPDQAMVSHQAHLRSPTAKKEKDSPKKGKRLSKQQKNKQPLLDFSDSQLSLEDVMTLFKPMPSCISPLQDLVRFKLFHI